MKIAIIGSGISGLTSAWYLHKDHDVTVFEANDYVGGHTATVDVTVKSGEYAIDTGFIVFNDRTYPNFENLLEQLDIVGKPSEMSFSVHNNKTGLEYNGHSLSSLFAQKRNLINPVFYRFLYEITQFNKMAKEAVGDSELMEQTLGQFLEQHNFSDYFAENYILPMGAAIWSSTLSDMRSFPLSFFLRFFLNHGLLDITNRPQWYVIPGGSREYVRKMQQHIGDCIRLNSPVSSVKRTNGKVIVTSNHKPEEFDQVIFACHSDQALAMLSDPTSEEAYVLSDIHYQENEVVLHTDTSLLPKRRMAWASWNYSLPKDRDERERNLASLTYNMNILQGIFAPETFCVTLNQTHAIDEDKILRKFVYSHPVFNNKSIAAQQKRHLINGVNQTWFCGAYWYNGFHEDGVRSALDVVEAIKTQSLPSGTHEYHNMVAFTSSIEPATKKRNKKLWMMEQDKQLNSGIYQGWVRHRRFTPVDHRFIYSMFMAYIDLAEISQLSERVTGFGLSVMSFARFRRDDYVAGDQDLAQAVKDKVFELTGKQFKGNVTMLCHLRYCGLYFSPLNLYYLHDEAGNWQYTLAEVSNTPWNERHYYAVPAPQYWTGKTYNHDKAFHVSPFNPIKQEYCWRLTEPDSNLLVHLAVNKNIDSTAPSEYQSDLKNRNQKVFDATMQMRKHSFSSKTLIKQLLLTSIMTIKVVAGIYWQALKLFIKGAPIYDHPDKNTSNNNQIQSSNDHVIKRGNDNA